MPTSSSRFASLALGSLALAAALSAAPASAQFGGAGIGATIPPWSTISPAPSPTPSYDPVWSAYDPAYALPRAEAAAAPGGQRVLRAAQSMIEQSVVVRGSCYDWVEAVFRNAGGTWHDAFRSRIETGPYAATSELRPGDWVLFVNGDYGDGVIHTHSAIFISWADESQRTAVMMSYPGSRRDEPGRFGTYTLDRVYRLQRMADELPVAPARRAHARSRTRRRSATHG